MGPGAAGDHDHLADHQVVTDPAELVADDLEFARRVGRHYECRIMAHLALGHQADHERQVRRLQILADVANEVLHVRCILLFGAAILIDPQHGAVASHCDELRHVEVGDADHAIWVGHATFLIRVGGLTVLTDPVWSPRASPLPWAGPRRYQPPGLPFEHLPAIDAVLISHDHYDHLDRATLEVLPNKDRIAVIVPLVLTTVFFAIKADFNRHPRLARWTLPLWLFVSVSGVVIYLLGFHVYPPEM